MTITEFLLARVAEDEAGARMSPREWWSDRLLAECEAKRRIVEDMGATADVEGGGYEDAHSETLRHLATVYAEHPNYDESWRP